MFPAKNKHLILFLIVFSQFFCTSLWFASNGIMTDLIADYKLPTTTLGYATSAVQLGFISGTLLFALTSLVDRFSPSRLFFISAIAGATFNMGVVVTQNTFVSLILLRFATGFCLAGIYPVGMKIAADYFEKGLGKSLGFLVGALVLGTALPHILRDFFNALPWQVVIKATSTLAIVGGCCILLFVADGPFRTKGTNFNVSNLFMSFKKTDFKKAAFGYFGHMWELYAFWAFTPVILTLHNEIFPQSPISVSLWSFIIIALGSLGCIIAGQITAYISLIKIARFSLLVSGICCLLFPLVFQQANSFLLLTFMCVWGFFVIADSPMFSSLVALHAIPSNKGTALTIVNCVGFSISILSIQLLTAVVDSLSSPYIFMVLALGPVMALFFLLRKINSKRSIVV